MAENNSILVFAVLAVIASLAAAGFSYYAVSRGPLVVGYATNTDTGTTNLSINTAVEIEFTTDTINFGSGQVATGFDYATLNTRAGTVTNGNWSANDTGLVLENRGNVNVTIDLSAGKTAAQFIGGTSPAYQWAVNTSTTAEPNSCTGAFLVAFTATNSSARACNSFGFLNAADVLRIDLNLTVPYDATTGAKSDVITATAAAA